MSSDDNYVHATPTETAKAESPQTLRIDGKTIGLFYHDGEFYATDNRCPHMGFPLTDGSVDDGILTCPWHHARFEISCGDTFDPFADDVRTYPVEIRDGEVYVDPAPEGDRSPTEHWKDRLEHGLEADIDLVVAKSVIGLEDEGVPEAVPVRIGTAFGTHYRRDGWGRGLTTLGVMTNLLDDLRAEDRRRALYVGLTEVADDCAGEPPFFVQEPLSADDVPADRLTTWFRDNIEVRDSDGAERVLRAAITADLDQSDIAAMLVAAGTDHRYLDTGHRLDFINKAFETLDHIGWEHADDVLPSLVPGLASASRAEENASWRQPIDIAELCSDAAEELPERVETGTGRTWDEPDTLLETLLGEDPHEIIDALKTAISRGASAEELAGVVTFAAARRVAHFGTSNEFGDWNTVHHTYTYANAVHGLSRRTGAWEVYRGVFDAAMNVYLDRFLNTPPTPLPDPDGDGTPEVILDDLLECFEVESDEEVNRAGRLTAEYLASGGDSARLKRALGRVLLREDVGFHTRQNVEAAFTQYDAAESEGRGSVHLVAAARYLAAHTPTRRSGEQTFRIAERLNRGEKIHEA
ncbi:Rieske (2Fe-2S) protein [Halovenus marina]|uniref:Rieske (2Fe-2S) protein n=1 Tax=Halovenus marina TaxID=3396621 RepID=UPI003F5545B2